MGNQATNNKTSTNTNTICSSDGIGRCGSDTFSTISTTMDHIATPSISSTPTLSARLSTPKPTPKTPDESKISPLPSYGSKPNFKSKSRRNSSFCNVNNGITGKYISSRISKIAAKFWQKNIETLSTKHQLEIGCAIFFGALTSNKEMKQIMTENLKQNNNNIERSSVKYLDMIGWLLRYLITDNIDLYSLLIRLGTFHQKMGVKINHFAPMLRAIHEALSYYFPIKYNIEVKYAMDEIFSLAAQIMTGQDLKQSSHLNNITKTFEKPNDIDFLKNLKICLKSTVGREYLYRYLQQTFCDEIALFLQTISKFKSQSNAVQRFFIARDIIKTSIKSDATFTLNLSYDCRNNTLHAMQDLEQQFNSKKQVIMNADFFSQVEHEVYKLILENHWTKFVQNIKILQSKSFGL